MAEQFFTVEQAASLLHVHPITVRRQLRSGVLRGIKTGKLWRVAESALTVPSPNSPPAKTDDPQAAADAIWRDMTSGDDLKRGDALKVLAYASEAVSEIVLARSGEVAAAFYASPEGIAEWEDQAEWRELGNAPFDDEDDEEIAA